MGCGASVKGKISVEKHVNLFLQFHTIPFLRKSQMSQKMMRLRIGAQGFTVVALMVGVGVSAAKEFR